MEGSKSNIIAQLQKEILPLQGYKPASDSLMYDTGLGPILHAFPNKKFPLGAVHEFICENKSGSAATSGFITGLIGTLMGTQGVSMWISAERNIHPPALSSFNVDARNIFFIHPQKEKDILWATEEALHCNALSTVVAEVPALSFKASRRLQLAVEQSRVTAFIIRNGVRNIDVTSTLSRWRITSLPGEIPDELPGVGFPKWNVEILKIRNGQPGAWMVSWNNGRFEHKYKQSEIFVHRQQKVG